MVGLLQFAPTKPERAFDLPAIVTKTTASFSPKDLIISNTFQGFCGLKQHEPRVHSKRIKSASNFVCMWLI